jgi:predicted nucleic acid-binding protein
LDRVLVDTSVWIEFFRKKEPYYSAVSDLMEREKVCCIGIVLAELLQGAKSEKELGTIRDFLHVFDFLPEASEKWASAGELSCALRRKGKSAGLSDCYIASIAQSAEVRLFTLDKHFIAIGKQIGLELFESAKRS